MHRAYYSHSHHHKENDMLVNSPSEPLMTPMQVAEYVARTFSVSKRQVYDRWTHSEDFPKPTLLPSAGKNPRKRYAKFEIDQWIEDQQKKV
jgi:predicted DNA-binding transcriptional regulator AlpA